MALDSPMCSACERPVGSGSFVRRGALVYCGQCNAKARADAYSRRESRSDSLLEVARQYAHGSASEDDVLGSAKDYAAACREEEALR
jgi:hypothetical protein